MSLALYSPSAPGCSRGEWREESPGLWKWIVPVVHVIGKSPQGGKQVPRGKGRADIQVRQMCTAPFSLQGFPSSSPPKSFPETGAI